MSELVIVLAETTLIIQEQQTHTLTMSAPGPQGIQGVPGPGVPAGGTISQLLAKASNADFETQWINLLGQDNAWTGKQAFSKIVIQNEANPALDTDGQLALDTTDNQLLIHNASAKVLTLPKKTLTFVLENPTGSEVFPMVQLPYAVTLTRIRGTILGGSSLLFTVHKRASTALNSSGTAMPNSTITATQAGSETSSFASANAAAGDHLVFISSSVSGAVTKIVVLIDFTIDRT